MECSGCACVQVSCVRNCAKISTNLFVKEDGTREKEKSGKGKKPYASSLLCGNGLLVRLLAKSEVAQELRVHL